MKNALFFKTVVLGAASTLAFGAALVPFSSFASEALQEDSVQQEVVRRNQSGHGMAGPYGAVTAINDDGNGSGTITLILAVPARPLDAPQLGADVLAKIEARIEAFFEKHPDALRPGDTITVAYDSDTKFIIGGEEASAADVTVGMSIYVIGVKPNSDAAATRITDTVRPSRGEHHRRDSHPRGMIGEVTGVNADTNTVTITLPDENEGKFTVGQRVRVSSFMPMHGNHDGSGE